MSKSLLQKLTVTAVGAVAGAAVMGSLTSEAQAATFYSGNFSLDSNTAGNLVNGTYEFSKTELGGGDFGYKVTSFVANISALLGVPPQFQTITLNTLTTEPVRSQLLALNTLVTTNFPSFPYGGIIPNVVNGAPYDYIGDGGFPPTVPFSYSYSFTGTQVAALPVSLPGNVGALFSQGGSASFSINSSAAAVPEPATMAGVALAGAGLAAARRRKQKQAA